jgi:hypothetical protein
MTQTCEKIDPDALTRAAQIAVRELKQFGRDAGTRERDFRISDRRKAIGEYLAQHPEVIEKAAAEVASWRGTNIKTSAQNSNRRKR